MSDKHKPAPAAVEGDIEHWKRWSDTNAATAHRLADYAKTLEVRLDELVAERDSIKALYEAGVSAWQPVYEILLGEKATAEARAEKAEADLKYVNEARTLDLADHQTKIKEMAERIRKAEAERDALAGRRPEVLLHWDSDGDFSWGATDGVDVVCVDERCPNDRVYETTGALSVEVIQRVADGRARHPIDALDQIAREATTPEDPVHD